MIDLTKFKIVKFTYPFCTEKLGEMLWDKMSSEESKWAVQLTLKGINDTGGDDESSWDIFFLDKKLQDKIENILKKYDIPFNIEDQSDLLVRNMDLFSNEFLSKLNSYLDQSLTVDNVLDRILEVGMNNLSIFEKYYLNKNTENI